MASHKRLLLEVSENNNSSIYSCFAGMAKVSDSSEVV